MYQRRQLSAVPDLLALHRCRPDRYPYLLASTTSGKVNTRYSLLMAFPRATHVQLPDSPGDILSHIETPLTGHLPNAELPFVGGWFVFLSYEYAASIEPTVAFHSAENGLPVAFISRIPAAIIVDHEKNSGYLVAEQASADLLEQMQEDLEAGTASHSTTLPTCRIDEENPDIYRANLKRILHYIREGDIFQANLSRLWQIAFDGHCDPVDVYARLSQSNPAPFAALVKFRDYYIISSSPERLIRAERGWVETRPIAGTHPRGKTAELDRQLCSQLIGHPKERAEHVMLIDLERNDLGRVCLPGSVQVQEEMMVESYQHVHHIVSSIRGQLQANKTVRDVLHAVFPGGTITGCPKVRCMQIISELEQAPRGAYTGSVGYVSDHGVMDFNILIRTMTMHNNRVEFRAGAGIVSDSITENELQETRHKARGLIHAFQPDH